MDIRCLQYILALAETGNMTRAAKQLYISQPTLSQFLSKLEQENGGPLFQRSGGVYTMTPAGELYADYARKVLYLTDTLEKDLKRVSNTTRITVATSASRALQMMTSILVDFRKYYPKVELTLTESNLQAISNAVSRGEVDIAFLTANSLQQFQGQSTELKREEVVFAAPSLHPYCLKAASESACAPQPGTPEAGTLGASPPPVRRLRLTGDDIRRVFGGSPFILQHKGSCIRYLIDDLFAGKDFNPIIACRTNNAQSICDMVAGNIGVGFIPAGYAVASPQITYFSLEPRLCRIHAILCRKDLVLGPPHKYLIKLATKYAEENWKTFDWK